MEWHFKSHRDLVDADYHLRGRVPCPLCGVGILIYQRLDRFPVFLDIDTFAQHIDEFRHADPPRIPPPDGKSAAAGE